MTMTDPIAAAARAAAERLEGDYGPGLAADVEAALHAQDVASRPSQYLDPVSLGSLIVAIATLAWNVYSGQRKKAPEPRPDLVARHVRAGLHEHGGTTTQAADRITEIVVTEIIRAARDPH